MMRYSGARLIRACTKGHAKVYMIRVSVLSGLRKCITTSNLMHVKAWLNLWSGQPPRDDKAVFLPQPFLLILKVG